MESNIPNEVEIKEHGFFVGSHKLPIPKNACIRDIWIAYREYNDARKQMFIENSRSALKR